MKAQNTSSDPLAATATARANGTEALAGLGVAVIGYGNQGRAHALNLRDSGVNVTVGARPNGRAWDTARGDGFQPQAICSASALADLLVIALPDEVHGTLWNEVIRASVRPHAVVGFLHGFSVHHGAVRPEPGLGVVMVAPKGPGKTLRDRFMQGLGIPALLAVHQGGADARRTRAIALAWAAGIGSARAAVVETTFAAECETDLFGEQAVLCGGMLGLLQAAFDTLVEAGYPPELAYMECCQELKQIADLVFERGPSGMRQAISNTAEFGAFQAGGQLVDDALRARLRELLARIRSGAFGAEFQRDAAAGFPWMQAQRDAADGNAIEAAGRAVRGWMPWLEQRKEQG